MAMLSRYQKSGGFIQLLKLIESCGKQKQENFLKLIAEENPKWAQVVQAKMLSIPKIMSWDSQVLAEISSRLNELTLATALHGFTEEEWVKLSSTFSHSQKRRIEDLRDEKEANAAEISAAFQKILLDVRQLISDGQIRVEKFAPELVIEDNIEENMGKIDVSASIASGDSESSSSGESLNFDFPPPSSNGANHSQELTQMYRKMQSIHNENQTLKMENKKLKEKLLNIRKMAA